MYLEDTILHSLQRVQAKLAHDKGLLEAKIIKSTNEYDTYRMLVELEYLTEKKTKVEAEIRERVEELQKPKTFWEKLFRK